MKIGYARVSTIEQNPDLQHDALKKAGCKKIYTDHASGAKAERPALAKALEHVRKGDRIVVWRLDRLGRSLKHLIEVVEDLQDRKVGFVSLQEGINTTTAGGRLVFHIFGALSEFERNLIRERTHAGLIAARARGRMGGRKPKLKPAQVKTLRRMYDSKKHTIKDICKVMGISKLILPQKCGHRVKPQVEIDSILAVLNIRASSDAFFGCKRFLCNKKYYWWHLPG